MAFTIELKDKVVLVTGATSGIGAGVAAAFAAAGASVAGCAAAKVSDAAPRAFESRMEALKAPHGYYPADVTQPEQLGRLVDAVTAQFGRIDVLVSNAGANIFEGAADCSEARWRENMDLNLASHWRLARLCKPYLEKSGAGVIILMGSNHGFATIPGCFPYNVAKTAMTGLVRSLAIEWAPAIRTVGLAPGFIDTPGNDQWFAAAADPAAERKRTEALHPVGRLGTAEEVGAWCVFLASAYSAFASGTTYLLDGGRSALMQDGL